ncbi:MAG: NAD(P)/FAD-dependent oxidoreductase [Blautia sp.]|nr:NAD(P)/FAD-dependent oxidoreductase [Blautia sp.]MCM1201793.1 NAD(P)/FAD-dependent oxidoreductase [Bacteroides fragilis]
MSRVIVTGGGAAGMMAAISAAERGHRVLLLEQNGKLGKKLFITGKGRCNVTNACEMDKLFENVVSNPKFLYSAFYGFDNRKVMALLEEAGCPLKTERGERVFPASDHSSDIIAALQRLLKKGGVEVRLHTKVQKLLTEPLLTEPLLTEPFPAEALPAGTSSMRVRGVCLADGTKEEADAVILATGGLSYPSTGSTGDGFRMAEELGHTKKGCVPALVPLTVSESWCQSLQGLSLKNVSLLMREGKKVRYEGFGEMLFTHFGVSGPLVLSASSFYGKCKKREEVFLELDLKPALSEEQLDKRLLRDFEENQKKQFKNALGGLFPIRLIPVMVGLSGIAPEKKVNEVTKEERRKLLELIKHLRLHVTGTRGLDEAIITQGGISVKEVNPSTMESRRIRGLYFAGELLDVDALTGGFNLQIAWATGHLAGTSIE